MKLGLYGISDAWMDQANLAEICGTPNSPVDQVVVRILFPSMQVQVKAMKATTQYIQMGDHGAVDLEASWLVF